MEEYDATYDSDEDVDFSKMDMVSVSKIHFVMYSVTHCPYVSCACHVTRGIRRAL